MLMSYFKKFLYSIVVLSLFFIILASCAGSKKKTPVQTEDPTFELQAVTVGNDITIDFNVTADWNAGNGLRGYTVAITITNNRTTAIDGWTLAYDLNGSAQVTNMWNANYVQTDATVTASNLDWNSTIAANGGNVNFGFEGTYEGPELLASAFSLNGEAIGDQGPLLPPPSPNPFVEVTLTKNSEWPNGNDQYGFTADVTITNHSDQIIDPWTLEFDFAANITNMWDGNYQRDGDHYTVNHADWNSRIQPHSSRNFGFEGNYTGSVFPELLNILLNGEPIGEQALEPLPEPWQRATLGAGRVFSAYYEDLDTFRLQVQPTDVDNPATHYVYQEREGDFTAQACIQSLTSDDPAAKAGLMLRKDNTDTSEYVYIGLMSTGTEVKHVDNTGTVHTVSGGQGTSTPRCYRLEKQEDSVYVYESGDGVNWVLVTTIAFGLVDSVNVGLAICASEHEVQAVVDDVVVEAQEPPGEETVTAIIGPQGGVLEAPNGAKVTITENFLLEEVEVKLETSDTVPEDNFPHMALFGTPLAIGPRVTVSVPFDKIDRSLPQALDNFLYVRVPPYEGLYEELISSPTGSDPFYYEYDLRFRLNADTEFSFSSSYDRSVEVIAGEFRNSPFEENPPEFLILVVQPVKVIRDGNTSSLQQLYAISPQGLGYPNPRGLFAVSETYSNSDGHSACLLPNGNRIREEFMPNDLKDVSEKGLDVTALGNKTPLVLLHGWQVGEEVARTMANYPDGTPPEPELTFAPAMCEWREFIDNFMDNRSVKGLSNFTLQTEYALFTLEYESRWDVKSIAEFLKEELSVFGNKDIVILAHSMGGVILQEYIQQNPTEHHIKHAITVGTPYLGSPILVCIEWDDTDTPASCTKAAYNESVMRSIDRKASTLWLSRRLVRGSEKQTVASQGTRDLSWFASGSLGNFFYRNAEDTPTVSLQNPYLNALLSGANFNSQNITVIYGLTDDGAETVSGNDNFIYSRTEPPNRNLNRGMLPDPGLPCLRKQYWKALPMKMNRLLLNKVLVWVMMLIPVQVAL